MADYKPEENDLAENVISIGDDTAVVAIYKVLLKYGYEGGPTKEMAEFLDGYFDWVEQKLVPSAVSAIASGAARNDKGIRRAVHFISREEVLTQKNSSMHIDITDNPVGDRIVVGEIIPDAPNREENHNGNGN